MSIHINPIELKDADDSHELVTKALGELQGSVEKRLADIEAKSADRLAKIEARINRPAVTVDAKEGDVERKAFVNFVRRGVERMGADEAKALTVANDASAGYLAPEQFGSEILKALVQFSPIRQYARVITIGGSEIVYPRRDSSTQAVWVSETGDRTATGLAYSQMRMAPHELACFADVSNALLEDNFYSLESELIADFSEQFGKTEGAAFVLGDGNGKPNGLLNATGIAEVKTGSAAAFPATNPADVIIGMYHSLPNAHAQNAVWIMNRNTIGVLRKWKQTTGEYLLLDPISAAGPLTLLGRPIVEAIDMPDIGADANPIIFGDMQGYRIVDRVGLSVQRDPFTQAGKGLVRFNARRRVGADLTHADRFVKLKVAA